MTERLELEARLRRMASLGVTAGYVSGVTNQAIMRTIDIFQDAFAADGGIGRVFQRALDDAGQERLLRQGSARGAL